MSDPTKINSSSIPWAQEVKAADPSDEDRTAYEFSNGRTFDEPKR